MEHHYTPRSKRTKHKYDYTLDVVTNGSEATEPTVFLSVQQRLKTSMSSTATSSAGTTFESKTSGKVVARYAILGLGDMTSRLVADQKISWTSTKAIFCNNNRVSTTITTSTSNDHNGEDDCDGDDAIMMSSCCCTVSGGGLWGLPSLLLALHQMGVPDLTVVTGNEDDASRVETMVELLEVHKSFPRLQLTVVPMTDAICYDDSELLVKWWKVYQDDNLIVHATCSPGRLEQLIYLFTCRNHETVPRYTIAVLPDPSSWQLFLKIWNVPEKRVVLEPNDTCGDKQNDASEDYPSIEIVFAAGLSTRTQKEKFHANARTMFPESSLLFCCPKQSDDGILIRAQSLMETWHDLLPQNIVWHSRNPPPSSNVDTSTNQAEIMDLPSCSTVTCTRPTQIYDRKHIIRQRISISKPTEDEVKSLQSFFQSTISSQSTTAAAATPTSNNHYQDENEIFLDDSSSEEDEEKIGFTAKVSVSETSSASIRKKTEQFSHKDDNEIDPDGCDVEESDAEKNTSSSGTLRHRPVPNKILTQGDDDEIDVADSDKEEDGSEIETSHDKTLEGENNARATTIPDLPHLLILGTGCAAPSPLRGSSGYGLLFPQQIKSSFSSKEKYSKEALLLTVIFEAGEGILNMLLRHLPSVYPGEPATCRLYRHLRHVKFIWISHGHWDHYGGLPSVVRAIHEARRYYQNQGRGEGMDGANKRPRRDHLDSSLLIVAPTKVLEYLAAMTERLYTGYTHEQYQSWWPYLASTQLPRIMASGFSYAYRPFAFWTNVRVDHSCFGAWGFCMGIQIRRADFAGDLCGASLFQEKPHVQTVTLAFSGDTRPCWRFAKQCLSDCAMLTDKPLNYLLHEASFDDDETAIAMEKKHTSLSEALQVAADTFAEYVILTHFSQRYEKYPPMKLKQPQQISRPVVFGLEGMLIPLKFENT